MKLQRPVCTLIGLGIALSLAACSGPENSEGDAVESAAPPPVETAAAPLNNAAESVEIVPGLSMRMLREGTGATAQAGQTAVVHYTGWLFDPAADMNRGQKFDSSVDRDEHFEFPLGARRVIRGWDEGVAGMQVGEVRELTIAPELAYGDRQAGPIISPGSTLVFEVELVNLIGADGLPVTGP